MGQCGLSWRTEKTELDVSQNVLTEAEGPTSYAERKIQDALSTFPCLMDPDILAHIRDCSVTEACRVLGGDSWDMNIEELYA